MPCIINILVFVLVFENLNCTHLSNLQNLQNLSTSKNQLYGTACLDGHFTMIHDRIEHLAASLVVMVVVVRL